jgi:methanogenic corrinoid protein MtbC1
MDPVLRSHAATLDDLRRGLADLAMDGLLSSDPALDGRYGGNARRIWRTEMESRLAHLAEAVACGRPGLFASHASWSAEALRTRGVPEGDIRAHMEQLSAAVAAELPDAAATAVGPYLVEAARALERPFSGSGLLDGEGRESTLARLYLLHLLQRDKEQATALALDALRGGLPLGDVYERVLAPAMAEIGRMWHMQEASIADEHYCTAATRSIVTQLRVAASGQARPADGRRAICCSVAGDMHEVGIRMVADLLELDGWSVEFLGCNVPAGEVVMSVEERSTSPASAFHLVVASASTTLALRSLGDLVATMRASPFASAVPLLVGGGALAEEPGLGATLGADAVAHSLRDAVVQAALLVPSRAGRLPR